MHSPCLCVRFSFVLRNHASVAQPSFHSHHLPFLPFAPCAAAKPAKKVPSGFLEIIDSLVDVVLRYTGPPEGLDAADAPAPAGEGAAGAGAAAPAASPARAIVMQSDGSIRVFEGEDSEAAGKKAENNASMVGLF